MKMAQRTVILELLLFLAVAVRSSAATHCLWYFYTATTPGLDLTEYTAEGRLDGEQFVYCNSGTKNMDLKTEWIKKCVSESWKSETQNLLDDEMNFKDDVVRAMQSFNNTAGVNTVKWMYGCELDDDGTERGYWQCGYDGEVYFSLKMNNGIFTVDTLYESTKQKWEEIIKDGNLKAYLQNYCIRSIKTFVDYRNSKKTAGSRKRRSPNDNTGCRPGPNSSQEHKESSGGGSNGVIGVVVGVLLLVLVVCGVAVLIWKKKSGFRLVSGNPSTPTDGENPFSDS